MLFGVYSTRAFCKNKLGFMQKKLFCLDKLSYERVKLKENKLERNKYTVKYNDTNALKSIRKRRN
jgi:hypothetical protein